MNPEKKSLRFTRNRTLRVNNIPYTKTALELQIFLNEHFKNLLGTNESVQRIQFYTNKKKTLGSSKHSGKGLILLQTAKYTKQILQAKQQIIFEGTKKHVWALFSDCETAQTTKQKEMQI